MPALPASSPVAAQSHVVDQPPVLEDADSEPSLEYLWTKAHDVLANNQGFYLSQDETSANTPAETLELSTSRGNHRELPDLTGKVTRVETEPAARGVVADYWKGIWHHSSRIYKVCDLVPDMNIR